MFLGLFGQKSAKITKLEARLEDQQRLIESQGQLISLQVEKLNSQLEELKALQENIASLHEKAFEQTLETLNGSATADLVSEVKRTITADPSFASNIANEMREAVEENLAENLDYDDLIRNVEISHEDIADNLANNLDLRDLTERLIRKIDLDDIASRVEVDMNEFSYSEMACEIEMYSLANEIDFSDLANEISIEYDRLAENLDYQAISARLDMNELRDDLSGQIDERIEEYVSACLPRLILNATTSDRSQADGDWTELEWAILQTVRRAIAEFAEADEADES